MIEREKYYFIFKYVDGSIEEFEMHDDNLESDLEAQENARVKIDNVIINMDNVIHVTIESESQREAERQVREEKNKENMKSIREAFR